MRIRVRVWDEVRFRVRVWVGRGSWSGQGSGLGLGKGCHHPKWIPPKWPRRRFFRTSGVRTHSPTPWEGVGGLGNLGSKIFGTLRRKWGKNPPPAGLGLDKILTKDPPPLWQSCESKKNKKKFFCPFFVFFLNTGLRGKQLNGNGNFVWVFQSIVYMFGDLLGPF